MREEEKSGPWSHDEEQWKRWGREREGKWKEREKEGGEKEGERNTSLHVSIVSGMKGAGKDGGGQDGKRDRERRMTAG